MKIPFPASLHDWLSPLAVFLLRPLAMALPLLANTAARWHADSPRRKRDQDANRLLRQIGRRDPERALALYAGLPPLDNPYGREPAAAEGPAPPQAVAPPGNPTAGQPTGTG